MSAQVVGDQIVVTGDGANDKVTISDGRFSGGDDYGIKMYPTDGGAIGAGGGCIQDPGPVTTTYCGSHTVVQAQFNLGDGDDTITGPAATPGPSFSGSAQISTRGIDMTEGNLANLPVTASGGDGNDRLAGDTREDNLDGGPGDDYLFGAAGSDTMRGGAGNDEMLALGGDDQMFGDDGNDSMQGGDGNDGVTGGLGADSVDGDGSFSPGQGSDTIDVDDGVRDTVACGLGGDSVKADQLDLVDTVGCETSLEVAAPDPAQRRHDRPAIHRGAPVRYLDVPGRDQRRDDHGQAPRHDAVADPVRGGDAELHGPAPHGRPQGEGQCVARTRANRHQAQVHAARQGRLDRQQAGGRRRDQAEVPRPQRRQGAEAREVRAGHRRPGCRRKQVPDGGAEVHHRALDARVIAWPGEPQLQCTGCDVRVRAQSTN